MAHHSDKSFRWSYKEGNEKMRMFLGLCSTYMGKANLILDPSTSCYNCPICQMYLSYLPNLLVLIDIYIFVLYIYLSNICPLYIYLSYICPIYICPILVVVEGSSGWRCGPFVLILPPHTSPTPCGNISLKYQENLIFRHID